MKTILYPSIVGLLFLTGNSIAQNGPRPGGGRGGAMDVKERKIAQQFDANKDGLLDIDERSEARRYLQSNPTEGRRGGRPGGLGRRTGRPGGPGTGDGASTPEITPGKTLTPDQVTPARGDLYSESTLRTLFLYFENDDWEKELEDFHNTDVDVPATLRVDGQSYEGVGVRFRGKSSYSMARTGQKRSLNLSIDYTDSNLDFAGYKTLNLNNSFGDGSLIGAAIYSHIARSLIPAPKVNLVRVVINDEVWGIYQNQQQFDKDFLEENFGSREGARWKAPGSPNGNAGLEDLGDDLEAYKARFAMKSGNEEDWKALATLCKTLNQTPADQLEKALTPMLDIEGVLRFLAIECALMNSDGYWTRASDFSLYRDDKGVFHIVPHDMNESFRAAHGGGGPRGGRGPQANGPDRRQPREQATPGAPAPAKTLPFGLDPLIALDDDTKPLRSKLLAVPALQERYLQHVKTIAQEWLDWERLGPLVASYRALIIDEVAADTRKNGTTETFLKLTSPTPVSKDSAKQPASEPQRRGPRGGGGSPYLSFAEGRRAFLLEFLNSRKRASK